MEGIQVSVSKSGPNNNISTIRVGGYIDTTTSAEVERALDELVRNGNLNVIVDLANVDYISSAGWGIFISEIKGIRERGGDLKLASMIPDVYEVFELLEFHYILKAYDTIEKAVEDFGSNSDKGCYLEEPASVDVSNETKQEGSGEPLIPHDGDPVLSTETAGSTEEKIKKIIIDKPDGSILDIKKTLNTEVYDFTKIGIIDIWNDLRKMGLSSKKKRMDFFKSQAFQS